MVATTRRATGTTPDPLGPDMTRSWSTRIAAPPDRTVEKPKAKNKPTIGPQVCERRTDGDRSTRMEDAEEWLARPDANALQPTMRNGGPPILPRSSFTFGLRST